MLPNSTDTLQLSDASKEKLDLFFRRFCMGENGSEYGLGHFVFACHAAFPMLLSPQLANLIWLNFKNYYRAGSLQRIDRMAVSDLLLSPLLRPVAARQYEMIPEIRTYLLYLLQYGRWFGHFGIEPFGNGRLMELANFLLQYLSDKTAQVENNATGFREINEWAATAYLQPKTLAWKMAQVYKENFDPAHAVNNEMGQLRLNLLMDRIGQQYNLGLHADTTESAKAFQNLHRYSKVRKATLCNEQPALEEDILVAQMDDDFIGPAADGENVITLPVHSRVADRLKRKKTHTQKVHALLVDFSGDPGGPPILDAWKQWLEEQHGSGKMDTAHCEILVGNRQGYTQLAKSISSIYASCHAEDICFIYLTGLPQRRTTLANKRTVKQSGDEISADTFFTAVHSANRSKCQTVLVLDAPAGDEQWVGANDVFISYSGGNSLSGIDPVIGPLLLSLLKQTNGAITYRDLLLWLAFFVEGGEGRSHEIMPLVTAGTALHSCFLSRQIKSDLPYQLLAYNSKAGAFQLIQEDFLPSVKLRRANVFAFDSAQSEPLVSGELQYNDSLAATFFYGGEELLQPQQVYKLVYTNPTLYYELINAAENAEELHEALHATQFDSWCKWGACKRYEGNPQPAASGVLAQQQHITVDRLQIRYPEQGAKQLIVLRLYESGLHFRQRPPEQWLCPLGADLPTVVGRINKYALVASLAAESAQGRRFDADISFAWGYGQAKLVDSGRFLEIDEEAIVTSGGKLRFQTLQLTIENREPFALHFSIYLLLSDLTIARVSANQSQRLGAGAVVAVALHLSDLLDRALYNGLAMQVQVLFSRHPITVDFSQPGINA